MRIPPPFEEKIKRAIRDAQALDPLMSITAMQTTLEKKFERTFSFYYVRKLCDKVARQARMQADLTLVEHRFSFTRENYRMMRERLLKIVYWTPETGKQEGIKAPFYTEIVAAAEKVVMLDLALLHAEINNGLYKKPIQERAKELRYEPLPEEVRAVIIAGWRRAGLLPAATVEAMVPKQDAKPAAKTD